MGRNNKKIGLAIIFHSGSYDRVYHGLSIALAALALGREVRLLFTYRALEYLRRRQSPPLSLDKEHKDNKVRAENKTEKARIEQICEFLKQAKRVGAKSYACVSSMAMLNITRDELVDEVDKSIGMAKFLIETEEDQILFI